MENLTLFISWWHAFTDTLFPCKGKAAPPDTKYRSMRAMKPESFLAAFRNSVGIPSKIPASLLGFLICEQPNGGHEKGYGVKVMPECHKKKFDFLWKNKFGKNACVQEIQNFFFLRSVQGQKNQYEFKQVDGVSVNGLASDFGENIRQ